MTVTLMEIVVGCENYLGWQPGPGVPMWKARSAEIGKLRKAIDRGNRDVTLANLALALEYSRRKRIPIKSPSGLLHRIEEALELSYIPPAVSDLTAAITQAIGWEQDRDDEQSLRWIHRLTRAGGPARADVITEWKDSGRG